MGGCTDSIGGVIFSVVIGAGVGAGGVTFCNGSPSITGDCAVGASAGSFPS